MLKFPNTDEMSAFHRVIVITNNPVITEHELFGKPVKAKYITESREIVIETDQGYYNFDNNSVLSVQFLKK